MSQKKKQRTSEWRQNQIDEEIALRVDEALKNATKRKQEKENGS